MSTAARPNLKTLILASLPIVVTVLFAGFSGNLYERHCGPVHSLLLILNSTRTDSCRSVTLTADLPSIWLGASVVLAAYLYRQSKHAWNTLRDRLRDSGVLAAASSTLQPGSPAERLIDRALGSFRARLLLAVVVTAVGALFYAVTFRGGYLFQDYAHTQMRPEITDDVLRKGWWANWHTHRVLAGVWIAVGSVGLYLAVRDLARFVLQTLVVRRLEASVEWQWVPSSPNLTHPWAALFVPLNLRIVGLIGFAPTFLAVVYLTRSPDPGGAKNLALASVAILVAIVYIVPILLYRSAVRRLHEEVILRDLERLEQAKAGDGMEEVVLLLRRHQLVQFSSPPSPSSIVQATRAALLLAGAATFAASIVQILVR